MLVLFSQLPTSSYLTLHPHVDFSIQIGQTKVRMLVVCKQMRLVMVTDLSNGLQVDTYSVWWTNVDPTKFSQDILVK